MMVAVTRHGVWIRWSAALALAVACGLATGAVRAADFEQDYAKLLETWGTKAKADKLTFEKAREQAEAAWEKRTEANAFVQLAENAKEAEKHIKNRDAADGQAYQFYQAALALAPKPTAENKEELLAMQLQCAFVAYQRGDYPVALVVAEHFARKNPKHTDALQAAQIAAAAAVQRYNASPVAEKKTTVESVLAINEFIGSTWPNEDEGREAWTRIAQIAISLGDSERALAIAKKLPADSPFRGEITLQMGLVKWAEYLKVSQLPEGDPKKPGGGDLERLRLDVRKTLDDGVTLVRKSNVQPSFNVLASELALVQIHNLAGDYDDAMRLLTRAKTGLLDQAMAGVPAAKQNALDKEIYKAALQTFVATQDLTRAEQMLERLAGDKTDAGNLAKMRLSLARTLKEDIDRLRESDPAATDALKQKLDGLMAILQKILADSSQQDFRSLAWVAQTIYQLGADQDPQGTELPADVAALYTKASTAYKQLIAQAEKAAAGTPEKKSLPGLQLNLAKCLRRLGKYEDALSLFESVLKEAPNNLDGQLNAAYTYQEWGDAAADGQYYELAMRGGPAKRVAVGVIESPIKGWGKLAQLLQSSDKYRAEYFEVRYNLAFCRARVGLMSMKDEEQKSMLQSAEQQILFTYNSYPDLGGTKWKEKYENLLKSIQSKLGKSATGFPTK